MQVENLVVLRDDHLLARDLDIELLQQAVDIPAEVVLTGGLHREVVHIKDALEMIGHDDRMVEIVEDRRYGEVRDITVEMEVALVLLVGHDLDKVADFIDHGNHRSGSRLIGEKHRGKFVDADGVDIFIKLEVALAHSEFDVAFEHDPEKLVILEHQQGMHKRRLEEKAQKFLRDILFHLGYDHRHCEVRRRGVGVGKNRCQETVRGDLETRHDIRVVYQDDPR